MGVWLPRRRVLLLPQLATRLVRSIRLGEQGSTGNGTPFFYS